MARRLTHTLLWGLVAALAFAVLVGPGRPALIALLAGDLPALRAAVAEAGLWAPLISAILMIVQGVLAPLPAFLITLANAALFGWLWGALLSWTSALLAAWLCFAIARWLGRPGVERFVPPQALAATDRFFARFGTQAVLVARLLPVVPFDAISYGAGLTPMSTARFLIATGIGQAPATLIYSYAGERVGSAGPILLAAAGVVALVAVIWVWRRRPPT
ncbi:MAG: TVP38/TMEM64 family protein [Alphaproteobacteria bacterium]|nr:TVP38/TMEM64 family protein [Alphaproteobacteria bacterium]